MATKNTATRNRMVNDFCSTWDGGTLSLYQMTHPIDYPDPWTLLAEFPLGTPAFNDASGGTATLHADSLTTQIAVASATGALAGVLRSAGGEDEYGEHELMRIDASTSSNFPLVISSITVVEGQPISLIAFTYTEPATV